MEALAALSGHCYCGRTTVQTSSPAQVVTYCHCESCRRVSGAPVTAWAAFAEGAVTFTPDEGKVASPSVDVKRSFCPECGSPLAHRYDYAKGQVFVGVGLFDDADVLRPSMHAHYGSRVSWLEMTDELEKIENTSRTQLAAAQQEVVQ